MSMAYGKESEQDFLWSPRVMQHYKDRERCPSTKKEFKFGQEVVADLKVFNLKSDLKDEV